MHMRSIFRNSRKVSRHNEHITTCSIFDKKKKKFKYLNLKKEKINPNKFVVLQIVSHVYKFSS